MRLVAAFKMVMEARRKLAAGDTRGGAEVWVRWHARRVEDALPYKYTEADLGLLSEAAEGTLKKMRTDGRLFPNYLTQEAIKRWLWLWCEQEAAKRAQARNAGDPLRAKFDPLKVKAKLLEAGFPERLLPA